MSRLEITRRRLLQAGGLVMVSSLLPVSLNALATTPVVGGDLPLDRVDHRVQAPGQRATAMRREQ